MGESSKKYLKTITYLVLTGVVLVCAGLMNYFFTPDLYKYAIRQTFVLSPNSFIYPQWKKTPIPIYNRFYMFNITNYNEVLEKRKKPILQEVGPYTFIEKREKVNITWNDNNGTVSYRTIRRWDFIPELTEGNLDEDMINHINVPTMTAGNEIKKAASTGFGFGSLFSAVGSAISSYSGIFVTHSVKQLLFDGYDNGLMYVGNLLSLTGDDVEMDKFGWFYGRNGTVTGGVHTIHTGRKDINKLGYMSEWKYKDELSAWQDGCRRLNDTYPGEFQPPFVKRPNEIKIFAGETCRAFTLTYKREVEYKGLKLLRYSVDKSMFDYDLEENKCFCSVKNGCPMNGVLDLSLCAFGAPVALSLPHFLFANKTYRQNVKGMKPEIEKHRFRVDIEPNLGIAVRINGRMQLNVIYKPNIDDDDDFDSDKNSSDTFNSEIYIPQFWTEVSASFTDEMIFQLSLVINHLPYFITVFSFVLILIGGLVLNFAIFYAIKMHKILNVRKKSPSKRSASSGAGMQLKQSSSSSLTNNNNQKYIPVSTKSKDSSFFE